MEPNKILDQYTLNIFTDASMTKIIQNDTEISIGSAGAQFYIQDKLIESQYKILYGATVNKSELTAILMGVLTAVRMASQVKHINLFSDSRISVEGLRTWVFNWIRNVYNSDMMSSSGTPVANQQILLQIIDTICRNNLRLDIYHVRGHLDNNTYKSKTQFERDFFKHNKIPRQPLDNRIIEFLINGNSSIDNYTRSKFTTTTLNMVDEIDPFVVDKIYYIENFDRVKYSQLIGLRR